MRIFSKITILFLTAALLTAMPSFSSAETPAGEGYDENTEIVLKGKIKEILSRSRGPIILIVVAEGRTYQVITGPHWYLSEQDISFKPDANVEITGSRYLSKDGALYIIAKQIKYIDSDKTAQFRDASLKPLWKHRGRHHNKY